MESIAQKKTVYKTPPPKSTANVPASSSNDSQADESEEWNEQYSTPWMSVVSARNDLRVERDPLATGSNGTVYKAKIISPKWYAVIF